MFELFGKLTPLEIPAQPGETLGAALTGLGFSHQDTVPVVTVPWETGLRLEDVPFFRDPAGRMRALVSHGPALLDQPFVKGAVFYELR